MKKSQIEPKGAIHKGITPDLELRFSFKYFDDSDPELCPPSFCENYLHTLMNRLKDLSSLTVQEFTSVSRSRSLRAHTHDWSKTSRPAGFKHLNQQLRESHAGWQFQLSSNEHGRVHGLLIGNTFFVIWLDQNHKLYP